MIDKLKRLMRSDWGLFGVRGAIVGLQAGTILIVAVLMGPSEFGAYAVMWSMALMSGSVVSLGFGGYLLRELPARGVRGEQTLPLWSTLGLGVIGPVAVAVALGVATGLGAERLSRYVPLPPQATDPQVVALVLAAALGIHALSCASVLVRVLHGPARGMAARDGLPQILLLAAATTLWLAGRLTASSLLATYVGLIVAASVLIGIEAALSGQVRFSHTGAPWRAGLLPFWSSGIVGALTGNLDVAIAGASFAPSVVGCFAMVKRVANLVSFPQIIANWAVATTAAAAHAEANVSELRRATERGIRLSFLPALAIAVVLLIALPLWAPILNLAPLELVLPVTLAFLAGNLASAFFGATFIIASQCGLEAWSARARVASVLLLAGLSAGLVSIDRLDVVTLAILSALATFVMNAIVWYMLRRTLEIDTSAACLMRPAPVGP